MNRFIPVSYYLLLAALTKKRNFIETYCKIFLFYSFFLNMLIVGLNFEWPSNF